VSLVLASGSASRRRLLEAAGLSFAVDPPRVDEEALKARLRAKGKAAPAQAMALADFKALSVSGDHPDFVIGADQMLALGDDVMDKPRDMAEARTHLQRLRGQTHELLTAVVVARQGEVLWRHMETPRLTMRAFSDAFIDTYLQHVGQAALTSVGAYQLEGLGAQLFERVEGDYFSVLGLPLLPLLAFLREQGVVAP
jgi:septum formation protein